MQEKQAHGYSYERKRGRLFGRSVGILGTLALGAAVGLNMSEQVIKEPIPSYDVKKPVPPRESKESAPLRERIIHKDIMATVFWVGEGGTKEYPTHNRSSAWVEDWVSSYGGVDDPKDRCGYRPCDFTPRENPFYFALPYNDIGSKGQKPSAKLIPWYDESSSKYKTQLKNRWIKVTTDGKAVYGQWADVGPFEGGDHEYVLGTAEPQAKRAGLDLSPAMADYLEIRGKGHVEWEFIEEAKVPKGPWKEIVTR